MDTKNYFIDSAIKRLQMQKTCVKKTLKKNGTADMTDGNANDFDVLKSKESLTLEDVNKYDVNPQISPLLQIADFNKHNNGVEKHLGINKDGLEESAVNHSSIKHEAIEIVNGKSEENEIQESLWRRLKNYNYIQKLKVIEKIKLHDPKECESCQQKEAEINKHEFIRSKKNKLESSLLDVKVDNMLYTQDTILTIGEIARTLPRPSEKPDVIWARLMENKGVF